MHHYLHHLHADIRATTAQLQAEPGPIRPADPFEAQIADIEAYLHGPQYDFEYWTGISQDELPVAERLSDEQCEALVEDLIKLWAAMKVRISFPEHTTVRTQYNAIRISWKDACSVNIEGVVWDFCGGWAPECPLGKECPCWEFWKE